LDLLKKKDLHPKIGAPKTTVADWITEFNIFIPKVRHERTTFYKPEAIEVLRFIKQCRDKHLQKHQIMQLLVENGFPLTVEEEEIEDDLFNSAEKRTNNEEILSLIKTDGQILTKVTSIERQVGENIGRINHLDERMDDHSKALKSIETKQNGQDERINGLEKRTDEIDYLKQENQGVKQQNEELKKRIEVLEQTLNQVAMAQEEEKKKGFFARLFGK
jgi:DNA-binding transcriptional MerR regulator